MKRKTKKDEIENVYPKMSGQSNAGSCDVPIVGRSRSFQQPMEEAEEQTTEALGDTLSSLKMEKN